MQTANVAVALETMAQGGLATAGFHRRHMESAASCSGARLLLTSHPRLTESLVLSLHVSCTNTSMDERSGLWGKCKARTGH